MQTKTQSIIESFCNVGSGFIISLMLWLFVISPLYGIEKDFNQGLSITILFTGISIVRGYLWRRIFNKKGGE